MNCRKYGIAPYRLVAAHCGPGAPGSVSTLARQLSTITAYLQAYKETKSFVEVKGKAEVIKLSYQNRTHDVSWNNMQLEK